MMTTVEKMRSAAAALASTATKVWVQAGLCFGTCSAGNTLVFSLLLYVFLTCTTTATFFGDTSDYADSIVARFHGRYYEFWEFGHVAWRPLVWAITRAIAVLNPEWMSSNLHFHVVTELIAVSWLTGFAALYFFHRIACLVTNNYWYASLSTVGLATAHAFLNYVQAGTPYIPGLAMLMLAIFLLNVRDNTTRSIFACALGGIALAAAVLLWFPYVLVVPSVVCMPLMQRKGFQLSIASAAAFILLVAMAYFAVIVGLGLHGRDQVLAWIKAGSHGIQIGGVLRAVFGFARSLLAMGNDGILFKRYLLRDPYSPVSVPDLFRAVLAKVALFYAAMVSVVAVLVIAKRWYALALAALACVPVLVFAAYWQGGDLERYLPLYPFLFLGLAMSLSHPRQRIPKVVCAALLAVMATVNPVALSRHANALREARILGRVSAIPAPSLPTATNILFVTHNGDDVSTLVQNFPWARLNRRYSLDVRTIIRPGDSDLPLWRNTFSRVALTAWERSGHVWISQRLVSPSPIPEWNWVEHDDPRISWGDLGPFFSRLEYNDCLGGNDGFCLLSPTQSNREILAAFARNELSGPDRRAWESNR